MELLGKILRTVCLAMLFGGSVGVVISAIVLVNAAGARGIPAAEAAAANAPVFIIYSKVNLVFGILLLLGEGADFAGRKLWDKPTIAQYVCSLLCVVSTMVFSFAIVPGMERLLPAIANNPAAHEEFKVLHHASRMIFGTTIVLALISLLMPIFGALRKTATSEPEPS